MTIKKAKKHIFEFNENNSSIDNMKSFLKWLNFNVSDLHYGYYSFNGNGISGGFSDLFGETHYNLENKIAFDNSECFNKFGQCPVVLELPTTANQFKFLEEQLDFWGGKDGIENNSTIEIKSYPRWANRT